MYLKHNIFNRLQQPKVCSNSQDSLETHTQFTGRVRSRSQTHHQHKNFKLVSCVPDSSFEGIGFNEVWRCEKTIKNICLKDKSLRIWHLRWKCIYQAGVAQRHVSSNNQPWLLYMMQEETILQFTNNYQNRAPKASPKHFHHISTFANLPMLLNCPCNDVISKVWEIELPRSQQMFSCCVDWVQPRIMWT